MSVKLGNKMSVQMETKQVIVEESVPKALIAKVVETAKALFGRSGKVHINGINYIVNNNVINISI